LPLDLIQDSGHIAVLCHRMNVAWYTHREQRHVAHTVCPTRYRTQHFFNNSNINEDIATKFEIFNTSVNQLDDEELSIGYFQQDGATSHTSHASMAEIQSFAGYRVISKGLCPPR